LRSVERGKSGVPKVLSADDIANFRDRLCDIAEDKFATLGIEGVTLRDLAGAMGVSPMTPYRYFKDKDAILAAVRARGFARFADAMEEAEAGASRKSGAFTGAAYVNWALKNPAAYRLMFDTQQPTAADYPELVAEMMRAKQTMSAYWRRIKAEGRFKGDVELAGHLMWSAQHGAVMLELAGLLQKPMDARKLAAKAILSLARDLGVAGA
jgi:AcrR family transcriptional regulator